MRIAIMTFFSDDSYGTVLQAAALCMFLRQNGHEADLINYISDGQISTVPAYSVRDEFMDEVKRELQEEANPPVATLLSGAGFEKFRQQFFTMTRHCSTLTDLEQLNEAYDAFICGSDRIWLATEFDPHMYLDFVHDPNKMIAYAPCILREGMQDLYIRKRVGELLARFQHLSVREENGRKLVDEYFGIKTEEVGDPVFLLSARQWEQLFHLQGQAQLFSSVSEGAFLERDLAFANGAEKTEKPAEEETLTEETGTAAEFAAAEDDAPAEESSAECDAAVENGAEEPAAEDDAAEELPEDEAPYLFIYFLSNKRSYWDSSYKLAQRLGLSVKAVPAYQKDLKRRGVLEDCIDPETFIDLIRRADYVCTDCYHAILFAILFQREMCCFNQYPTGKKTGRNARVLHILEAVGLTARMYDDNAPLEQYLVKTDFIPVQYKLDALRLKSVSYLNGALEAVCAENLSSPEEKTLLHVREGYELCCGCGACEAVCPEDAVHVRTRENGFLEAVVSESRCTRCGKCAEVCPMRGDVSGKPLSETTLLSYSDEDEGLLSQTDAGGLISRLMRICLENDYAVAGCAYDEKRTETAHVVIRKGDDEAEADAVNEPAPAIETETPETAFAETTATETAFTETAATETTADRPYRSAFGAENEAESASTEAASSEGEAEAEPSETEAEAVTSEAEKKAKSSETEAKAESSETEAEAAASEAPEEEKTGVRESGKKGSFLSRLFGRRKKAVAEETVEAADEEAEELTEETAEAASDEAEELTEEPAEAADEEAEELTEETAETTAEELTEETAEAADKEAEELTEETAEAVDDEAEELAEETAEAVHAEAMAAGREILTAPAMKEDLLPEEEEAGAEAVEAAEPEAEAAKENETEAEAEATAEETETETAEATEAEPEAEAAKENETEAEAEAAAEETETETIEEIEAEPEAETAEEAETEAAAEDTAEEAETEAEAEDIENITEETEIEEAETETEDTDEETGAAFRDDDLWEEEAAGEAEILAGLTAEEKMHRLQGAKLSQSNFSAVWKYARANDGKLLITGTPCQIAAARKVLGSRDDIVYVDFVCGGLASDLLFAKYRDSYRSKENSNFRVQVRYKNGDKGNGFIRILDGEKERIAPMRRDALCRMLDLGSCCSRACYNCRWRDRSEADLRVGSAQGRGIGEKETGMIRYVPTRDDVPNLSAGCFSSRKENISVAFVVTEKGQDLLNLLMTQGYWEGLHRQGLEAYLERLRTENRPVPVYYPELISMLGNEKASMRKVLNEYAKPVEKRERTLRRLQKFSRAGRKRAKQLARKRNAKNA